MLDNGSIQGKDNSPTKLIQGGRWGIDEQRYWLQRGKWAGYVPTYGVPIHQYDL
jgi:hypothetical protein